MYHPAETCPTFNQRRRSCFQEQRTPVSGSEAGKSSFNTSLNYIKVGFGGRRFQPLLIGLRVNQWYGPGTARAVLLGKREGLRPDGSGASPRF